MNNSKETCTAWYGWNKNIEIRMSSTSGGVFTAIAEYVLSRGGAVIGAYFDADNKKVKHGSSDDISIERMQRSKYVESDVSVAPMLIDTYLKRNRLTLFCGTPCQCAGMRKLFGESENLLLCDFFCHGVPSPKVFKDFLNYKEKKRNAVLVDYQFRTKDFGWSQYGIKAVYSDGYIEKTVGRCEFVYVASMLDNNFLRKSCYTCDKAMYHVADLTIGDFWGISKIDPTQNDNKGISVLVANTAFGKQFVQELNSTMELFKLETHYLDYAFRVKTADKKLVKRNSLFEEYDKIGIEQFIRKYYSKRLLLSRMMFAIKRRKLRMGK